MPNDNRPKRSWRDIDKLREGGGSRGSSSQRPDPQQDHQSKQYRAALEALFNKGEFGKIADKLSPPPGRSIQPSIDGAQNDHNDRDDRDHKPDEGEATAAESAATETPKEPPPKEAGKKKAIDERIALRKKLMEAIGRHDISRAAEKYLERFPLPDDHEFLEQLLEHEQEGRTAEAMARIAELLDRHQPPRRSRALCGKLRYLAETTAKEELKETAQALLKRLG